MQVQTVLCGLKLSGFRVKVQSTRNSGIEVPGPKFGQERFLGARPQRFRFQSFRILFFRLRALSRAKHIGNRVDSTLPGLLKFLILLPSVALAFGLGFKASRKHNSI